MQKNLPEGKSLDWYKAEIEKKEQEIEIACDLIGIVPMELLNAVITGKAA